MIAIETERNWKPVIKEFEAVVGKNGVVQRREELIVYECDGTRQLPPAPRHGGIASNYRGSGASGQNMRSQLNSLGC